MQPIGLFSRGIIGVFEPRAECILMTGRLRQPIGRGFVLAIDLTLTRQIPVLPGPRIHRFVVHIERLHGFVGALRPGLLREVLDRHFNYTRSVGWIFRPFLSWAAL
jgi:hypothetical protein